MILEDVQCSPQHYPDELLHGNKNEQTPNPHNSMDEFHRHDVEKRPDTKQHPEYDFMSMEVKNTKS